MQVLSHTPTSDVLQHAKTGEFLSSLTYQAMVDVQSLQSVSAYPENSVMFEEKQAASHLFIVLEGQVKLSMNSSEGRRLILRIAKPGEVLGLTSILSGTPFEMTAETLHPCKIASIRRQDFLSFLLRHPAAYESVARELSQDLNRACEQLRTVGLASSAPAKLARLLLGWSAGAQQTGQGTRLKLSLTHEEIGECIGASRETVTRTLCDFKHRHLVDQRGSTLMIPNRVALESCAGF